MHQQHLSGNTRTWKAHADSIILILPSVTQQCRGSAISTNSGQKFNFVNENRSYLFKWNPSLHDSLMTVENFFKFPEYSKMIFFLLILIKEFQSLSFKLITTFFLVSISFRPRSKSSLKHFSIYFEPLKKSILVLSSIIFYSKNWKSFFWLQRDGGDFVRLVRLHPEVDVRKFLCRKKNCSRVWNKSNASLTMLTMMTTTSVMTVMLLTLAQNI